MKQSRLKPGKPRRLSEEERTEAWEFKLAVIEDPCAGCEATTLFVGGSDYFHAHHVISADYLRRYHSDHVYDRRNALNLCAACHDGHTSAMHRLPRSCLRPENEQFAQELGLEHLLDRFYPQGDGS